MSSPESVVSLAQLPMCWDDRRLLDHDPFNFLFQLRWEGSLPFEPPFPAMVKAAITTQTKEFSRAFIRWCLISFAPLFGEPTENLPDIHHFVKNAKYWELFVDVFYDLFSGRGTGQKALTLVNNARKELGFKYFFIPQRSSVKPKDSMQSPSILPDVTEACAEIPPVSAGVDARFASTHTALQDRLLEYAGEIETASETFMSLPAEGDVAISEYSQYKRRTSRRVAPPQNHLAGLGRNDKAAAEIKSLRVKQKRASKKGSVSKRKGRRRTEIHDEKVVRHVITSALGSESDAKDIECDAEQIVMQNKNEPFEGSHVNHNIEEPGATRCSTVHAGKEHDPDSISASTLPLGAISMEKMDESLWRERKLQSTMDYEMLNSADGISQPDSKIAGDGAQKNLVSQLLLESSFNIPALIPTQAPCGAVPREVEDAIEIISVGKGMDDLPACSSHLVFCQDNQDETGREPTTMNKKVVPLRDAEVPLSVLENSSDSMGSGRIEHDRHRKMMESFSTSHLQFNCPKPPLPKDRQPRIWAGSRQALCETTAWFRSYHGGVYFNDGKAYGYLLGGYSAHRDVFHHDGRIIISHGGGKSLDGSTGQRDKDPSVRALLYNHRSGHPLVLIADDKYVLFPFDLGEKMYVVLGLYWIVDAWAEKDVYESEGKFGTRIKYKFAFQYCDGQESPWWLNSASDASLRTIGTTRPRPAEQVDSRQASELCVVDSPFQEGTPTALPNDSATTSVLPILASFIPTNGICTKCGKSSPSIYKQGWMCLHPDCEDFFRINSEEIFSLDYFEQFLQLRPCPDFGKIELSIPSPLVGPVDSADEIYSTRGFWCPECGQLCPRERWECWECSACEFELRGRGALPMRSYTEFKSQESNLKGYTVHKIYPGSEIKLSTRKWRCHRNSEVGLNYVFELPCNRGRIHLVSGNARVNDRANTIFRQYQQDAESRSFLRRYPLRSHHARGRMLTNYFSHNAGVPYEYAVVTNITDTFDKAPQSVNDALQLIKDRTSPVIASEANFNEILTAAYMSEQKMSYHTDDERGLGPVVASLSLGSIAYMHFRLRKSKNSRPDMQLSLVLRHGDVLIMEGAEIQKAYEHTVVPMNFRIAATARYIEQYSKYPRHPYINSNYSLDMSIQS
ncbi:uncharacterized protein FOMMEDRAFT_107970 [Fomitiporia mediterranea MF3/22]|uniref:uncharacterized protein n=1 Tax=Fomitiporia mediterranea (strain MF3/22) TaxID=694068 RepID=UPI000440831C|nr:uncharacterized protein FOMMEDRAFT_107970 [Fomitiporia mediterranea MF3/22]EJD02938.1 hypothetical protein FOMMEDRAFT_107970 [Fomitiporia mediterranea MF3/22]